MNWWLDIKELCSEVTVLPKRMNGLNTPLPISIDSFAREGFEQVVHLGGQSNTRLLWKISVKFFHPHMCLGVKLILSLLGKYFWPCRQGKIKVGTYPMCLQKTEVHRAVSYHGGRGSLGINAGATRSNFPTCWTGKQLQQNRHARLIGFI